MIWAKQSRVLMGLFKMKSESIYHREGRVQKLRTLNVRQGKLNCLYFYFLYVTVGSYILKKPLLLTREWLAIS